MVRSLVIIFVLAAQASGCVVDIPIEKETKVFTIEGNATLHAAGARIFGEIVRPYKVTRTIDERDLSTVRLTRFVLEVTGDSEAPGDTDDLSFVESAVLLIESNDPAAGLPVLEIAWYDLPGVPAEAPRELVFDVAPGVELKPYFRTGFRLSSECTHLVPPDDVSLIGRANFHGEHVVF
jgi:hypothetical protein